jgi:hypothetical protein
MSTPSYNEIRQQIERRYRRRSLFIYHCIIAAVSLLAIWLIKPFSSPTYIIFVLWMGLILLHGIHMLMEGAKDRAIERMWRRYYGDIDYEKPKRTLHLTDDAELEEIEDELPERKYRQR